MELEGNVENGVVVLGKDVSLPEGTRVKVTVPDSSQSAQPTHYELFRDIIGKAVGLPEDMAENHNHYIRGGPKQ